MILVTGSTGFVGVPLIRFLSDQGHDVVALSRTGQAVSGAARAVAHPDILAPLPDGALDGVTSVVHLAGIAHRGRAADPGEYDRVNNKGAVVLAERAAEAGVGRFVFLSTAKVHGAVSKPIFHSDDPLEPPDAYSEAKAKAEQALEANKGDMSIVRLRPPVIFGPNPKANVRMLAVLAMRGLPLPTGDRSARRSLLHIDSLCSAILQVLRSGTEPSGGYLLADTAMTTAELYSLMCASFGTRSRLFPANGTALGLADKVLKPILGRQPFEPLYSNFEVDGSTFSQDFGWTSDQNIESSIEELMKSMEDAQSIT